MFESTAVRANSIEWMHEQNKSGFDLIIADPPYNVGKDYGVTIDQKEKGAYLDFTKQWTAEAARLLNDNGTLYVFMGFRFISHLYEILEDECGLNFNTWICWHYTQGQGRRRGYSTRHDDILMFTKSMDFTFNLDGVRVPQKYYRSVNNMRGANPGDVWEFSHIHYCQENRQTHPTQKPEGLIERMILASSNPGDCVLDPFSGSGTTLRVCQQLSRHCVGVDINPDYVEMAKRRLQQPFHGFDSIDPRMKRIPLDLNDPKIRGEYIENHIKWFLNHHETDIADFNKRVERRYGPSSSNGKRRKRSKSAADGVGLFSTR